MLLLYIQLLLSYSDTHTSDHLTNFNKAGSNERPGQLSKLI